ncbi:hypothetical protein HYALB_00012055 [Hymenoscyphus albidus]|uniref:Uncharacterized protein n=1 Tax=Hymenoscyphus albidus TaxID=595503 RepID=A0A9N9LV67_9HELO|nr:hypothetical protein HYALB_00012055 [Hymenoscyphus albidus]
MSFKYIKKPGSKEDIVDAFWMTLLPDYFPKRLNYSLHPQRHQNNTDKAIDVVVGVRVIRHNGLQSVILIEDKRRGLETRNAQWADALSQLTDYMLETRKEKEQAQSQVLYGAVNIGT